MWQIRGNCNSKKCVLATLLYIFSYIYLNITATHEIETVVISTLKIKLSNLAS